MGLVASAAGPIALSGCFSLRGCVVRRFLSAALAVLLAGGLVLVAAPAYAVEPPPPPVAESPYSSTTLRQTSSPFAGGPLTEQQKAERALRYSLLQGNNTAGAVDTPDRAPQPAGQPSALTRVAAGAGILTAGVLVVPMFVQGGIKMMGISAEVGGQSYDQIVCGSLGSTNDGGFMEWLYSDLDCTPAISNPNPDVTDAETMTLRGVPVTWVGRSVTSFSLGFGLPTGWPLNWCYSGTVGLQSGEQLQVAFEHVSTGSSGIYTVGNWVGATHTVSSTTSNSSCPPGQLQVGASLNSGAANGVNRGYFGTELRVKNTTTGDVVAQSVAADPDPERQVSCDVEWSDGSVTTGTAATYRETEGFPLSDIDCQGAYDQRPSEDAYPVGISIDSDAGGTSTRLAEFDVPADLEEPKPGRGMRLEKVVDGVSQSCMTWEADCVGWWSATEQGTLTTSPYRCLFGDAQIDLAECGLYRFTFDEKTSTPTLTDPVTGEEVPWRSTDDTRNSTNPGTGPTPGEDCLNNWPSIADPISWVLHPVKCALVWAFVPRTSEVDRLTGELTSMWEDTGVGLTVNTITAWEFDAPASGCSGVLVPMSTIFQHGVEDFRLLDACAGSPLEQTAVWSYWIILIASIINLIASISRNIGSVVGARGVAEADSDQ